MRYRSSTLAYQRTSSGGVGAEPVMKLRDAIEAQALPHLLADDAADERDLEQNGNG
jgi:hypothetical protein